ncbi:hypothetical protein Tco_0678912 [Tanacetum coccineum]|uniref:Reverse transcriptase domain-containing protein n=1 Tax=Tanacetum coccineum TaxID=301880 RepID=A0ABQ4XGC8_9ASTR
MDRLSKRKFVIVCHEKVVRIPLEGDEILRVHGERTQGVVKTLMNTKVVAKYPYRLAPLEMQELSEQLQELQDEVLELLRKEKLYTKFTKSEVVKNWEVPTTPSEICYTIRDMKHSSQVFKDKDIGATLTRRPKILSYEIRYHLGIGQMLITDALIGKERVRNLHRVRAAMSIVPVQYGMLRFTSCVWQERCRNVTDAIVKIHEYCRCKQPQAMYKVNGMIQNFGKIYEGMFIDWCSLSSNLIIPELVQEMTDKVVLIKEKLKAARDRQKSCADNRRKPLEFEVGERVMLKVSPWKGVIRFGKKGKLAPRFLTSLLDDGRGSGSWMFLFVWSGYAAMRTLCGQAKLLALNLGTRFPKGGDTVTTMTWADRGTRSIPLFVVLESGRLRALMDCRKAHLLEDKQIPSVGVFDELYLAFGRHLEEIHVTWAHLEKKRTRLRTYTNISQDYVLRG